ncbi:hypothetical protein, partial [Streptomyces sp. Agncl-13]|uniref:hypothetical protein n=1 Tax=Streptomyces sp. Agncl-13 TaxID=3400628 RepID=UPI003A83CC03
GESMLVIETTEGIAGHRVLLVERRLVVLHGDFLYLLLDLPRRRCFAAVRGWASSAKRTPRARSGSPGQAPECPW